MTQTQTNKRPSHPFIASSMKYEWAVIPVDTLKVIAEHYMPMNRPVNSHNQQRIVGDIIAGAYDNLTGNPIKFDSNGNDIDGQHRILAHIEANKNMETLVVYGLKPEAILQTDRNAPRNMAISELLFEGQSTGEKPTTKSVSYRARELTICKHWLNQTGTSARSEHELDTFRKSKQQILEKVLFRFENESIRRAGVQTAIAMYFDKAKDQAKAKEFLESLGGDGNSLPPGSPILCLRNYLIRTSGGSGISKGGNKLRDDYKVTVAMIHAHYNNKSVKNISRQDRWEF